MKEAGRGAEVLGILPRSLLRLLPVARPQSGKEQQPAFLNLLTCSASEAAAVMGTGRHVKVKPSLQEERPSAAGSECVLV